MVGMGGAWFMGGGGCVVLVLYILLSLLVARGAANVVLIGRNVSLSFDDIEANFAPTIKGSGESGVLYLAEPLDACSPLTNKGVEGAAASFALIIRGGCTFDDKVRIAQKAGFKAAIVYDNEDSGALVASYCFCILFPNHTDEHGLQNQPDQTGPGRTGSESVVSDPVWPFPEPEPAGPQKQESFFLLNMRKVAGSPVGIKIHAVFVSKASGQALKKYAGLADVEVWIIPTFENSAWSIMAISFISLLAMSAVLATCFFVRRHRIRREQPRAPNVREFHGMSSRLVKAMPSLIFTAVLEDNCTSRTCAICLEDYNVGEKLRILPCRHKFHAFCVDSWLTSWRTFCPVCKRDARTSTGEPPASECTPLLSSVPASPASSVGLSSFHSSGSPSPAMQIVPSPTRSLSASQNQSVPSIPRVPHSHRSHCNSPSVSLSRSSADLRNLLSHRSSASYLMSAHSLGVPVSSSIHSGYASPLNSRYASPYIHGSSIGSPSYLVGSSGRRQSFLHDSSSAASLSALASACSLPEC